MEYSTQFQDKTKQKPEYMSKHTLIARLKEMDIVQRRQVQLSHAGASNIYFDVKKAYGDVGVLQLIVDAFHELMHPEFPQITCIAANGYGGIPPASILAIDYDRNLSLIRDTPKEYGLQKLIEGRELTKDDCVAVIDDVTTTGSTFLKSIVALQQTPAKIIGCYTLIKRGEPKLPVPFRYVMTAEELL